MPTEIVLPGNNFVKFSALVSEGYRLGASTFLTKPLEMQEVMQLAKWSKKLRLEVLPNGNVLSL